MGRGKAVMARGCFLGVLMRDSCQIATQEEEMALPVPMRALLVKGELDNLDPGRRGEKDEMMGTHIGRREGRILGRGRGQDHHQGRGEAPRRSEIGTSGGKSMLYRYRSKGHPANHYCFFLVCLSSF